MVTYGSYSQPIQLRHKAFYDDDMCQKIHNVNYSM